MITPVTFELAKLLKEKGFDKTTLEAYIHRGVEHKSSSYKGWLTKNKLLCDIPAPTISEVVMWLYEKHGIWVYTKPVLDEDGEWIFKGYVKHLNDFKAKEYQTKLLREPTEAYEAAIEYTLNKLI